MTTTPLPPLPDEDVMVADGHDEYGYATYTKAHSTTQLQAYATQARADLEAENARLREALQNIKHMKTFAIDTAAGWCPLATEMVEIARSALENQP